MDKALSEIKEILRKEGIENYILATEQAGINFFIGQGKVAALISKAIEGIFETDPQKATILISQILQDVANWYAFNGKKQRTVH